MREKGWAGLGWGLIDDPIKKFGRIAGGRNKKVSQEASGRKRSQASVASSLLNEPSHDWRSLEEVNELLLAARSTILLVAIASPT